MINIVNQPNDLTGGRINFVDEVEKFAQDYENLVG
jgi:hypothetical protein